MIYHTLNYQIDDQALTVKNAAGVTLNIRPKTCQLLLFLVKNSGKALSKHHLLDIVWADSVVSEQVVFQSINELRQLFPGIEVIKTIPKQGYVWLPEVIIKEKKKPAKRYIKKALFAISALVIVLTCYFLVNSYHNPANEELHKQQVAQQNINGSIIILPTNNQIEGNDHNWIRLGMMDQVIQRLPNSQHYGILQTDYVFEVLKRAKAPLNNLQPKHIQQVFKVSGAELIVSSKLSGSPHDYQLSYTFSYRNRLKKGILFNKEIQNLIDEFSQIIATQLGGESLPLEITYQADFNNELLGAAIEKRLAGNYQAAHPMLEAIVLNNPENITAQRILVENLLSLRLFERVTEHLAIAIPIANKAEDKDELTRLLYLKALNQYATYHDSLAANIAVQALALAKKNNDWLLMAYIKNIQAAVAINHKNYQLAEKLYHEEMQHHQVLHCPAGEAQSWANLAKLAKMQNQKDKFISAMNQAINIAKERELTSQLNYFLKTKEHNFNQ